MLNDFCANEAVAVSTKTITGYSLLFSLKDIQVVFNLLTILSYKPQAHSLRESKMLKHSNKLAECMVTLQIIGNYLSRMIMVIFYH